MSQQCILYCISRLSFNLAQPISDNSFEFKMIFNHPLHYKFDMPIDKVHYFSPAFDDTIVIVGHRRLGQDFLGHFNKQGQSIYNYDFQDLVDTLVMPTDRMALVLRVEEGLIYQFDLKEQTVKRFRHFFMVDVSCQVSLDYFCDTNLICIQENGDHNDQRIAMTYYEYPFDMGNFKEDHPPKYACQFTGDNQVWTPAFLVRKVNSHSKYVWYETRHKDVFRVKMLELIKSSHTNTFVEKYQAIEVSMSFLYEQYHLTNMEAAIVELWEFQPNVLLLFCATSKNEMNAINMKTGVVNNTFLWDTELRTIRESKFTLPPQFQDLQIDFIGSPQLSMFRTFNFGPGKALESPAYFVSNSKEEIVHEETWVCSHLQKYKVFERNRNTIIEGIYPNRNVEDFSLRIISLCSRPEMSMFLLEEMQQKPELCQMQWDYSLLMDIFHVLDYPEVV